MAGYKLNVADRDMVLATVERVVTEFGAPDIVINMAGIGGAGELASEKFEVFCPVDAAVRGLVNGIRRDQFLIIPGFKVKAMYWSHRLAPVGLWNGFTDAIVAKAMRENT